MKTTRVSRFGPPAEVVELIDIEPESPGPGEVRVRVEASPINPANLMRCEGRYGYGDSVPRLPFSPGLEGVGRVEAVGEGVAHLAPGDRVALMRVDGIWGHVLVTEAQRLIPLPAGIDPLQAAMVVINPPTAELMLSDFVDLASGDWVIQNAANSAVGHYVITLAAMRGLRTANVVRRTEVADELKAHGGDVVVVDGPDLMERVKAETGGALARLALDAVAGEATGRIAQCVRSGGTVVNYGALSAGECRMPVPLVLFNDVRLRGFLLPRALAARSGEQVQALYGRLIGLVADGTLAATVETTYPLERIAEALEHAARGGRAGKILITP